jgi:flagellar hook assembly protein FlgD
MIYPNPVKDFATFNFTASEKGNTKINIYDQSARLVKSIEKNNLPKGQNSVSADLSSLEKEFIPSIYNTMVQKQADKNSSKNKGLKKLFLFVFFQSLHRRIRCRIQRHVSYVSERCGD